MKRHTPFFNIEKLSGRLVHVIGMVLFFLLCFASLLFTRYFPPDYSEEVPLNKAAVFPLTLLGAVLLAAGILRLGKKLTENQEKAEQNLKRLLYIVLLWIVIGGSIWVMISCCAPASDQLFVLTSAQRFSEGNYGRLEYGKYLFMHPHQLGLTAYEECIFRIFGKDNIKIVLMCNVLGIAGAVYCGYQITRYLFQERKTAAYYLLLVSVCFPLFLYSTYFYGDVLEIAFSLFAVWHLLRYIKKGRAGSIVFCVLGSCIAVLIRNNSVIVMIACTCVLLVKGIADRRWQYALCVILLFGSMAVSRQSLWSHYEKCCGHELNKGLPMNLYIAMGMQEGDKEAGWYNGYGIYVYQDICQYDGPAAAALGKAEIRARVKEFLFHPGYAADFYWRKFSSQWSEPTYGSFFMTHITEEERGAFARSVFEGEVNKGLKAFMDCYQLLIYAMVLLLLLRSRKKEEPLENYILLIVIIGGVLFHLLWEAKSRYVLPYFIMMLPMAAGGLYQIGEMIQGWRTRNEAAEAGR